MTDRSSERRLEIIDKLVTLTEIPAPSHKEQKRAAWLRQYLEKLGYCPIVDEADNVLIELAGKSEDMYLFTAHTDTVFPDDSITVIKEGNCYRAPGIGDDTCSAALMLQVLEEWMRNGLPEFEHTMLIVFNSGEEGLGDLKGIRQIMKTYGHRVVQMISFDGYRCRVMDRAVGSKRYLVNVSVEGGHSYRRFGRASAIAHAAHIISSIYEIDVMENASENEAGTKTTYNVGTIEGGTSVNTIAQSCEFLAEVRSDCREGLERVNARLLALFEAERSDEVCVTWKLVGDRPSMGDVDMEKQQALSRCVCELMTELTGEMSTTESGSTDCNIPLSMGIPAVAFGAHIGGGAHTRDEWVDVSSLEMGFEIVKSVMEL